MERKDIDWGSLGFGYVQTDYRYVANYKDGKWDEGGLTDKATIEMSECACVLQYAQTCFEGLKAYTTADGKIVCFRDTLLRPIGISHKQFSNILHIYLYIMHYILYLLYNIKSFVYIYSK